MALIDDLLSNGTIGRVMGRSMGLDRALTANEVEAYAKASRKMDEEAEIDRAISLLEDNGYTVLPPK